MKKIIIITVLSFISVISYGQKKDDFGFDYEIKGDHKVLVPTWNNIFDMVNMPLNIFGELMHLYDYKYDPETGAFMKRNKKGAVIFMITHNIGEVSFVWWDEFLDTNKLEKEFESYYVKEEEGAKVYIFRKENEGLVLKLVVMNKKEKGGVVSFMGMIESE